ncbi:AraC family transcriptional regulator [Parazoarcus communis]|uniref:AraC family transcriptional regulator n=1 Tax=Parazoarcus communis SWub3 = DSM 12120 TaxID=1121029 RepID=A0A323V1W9_9RHOO|nr:helix-turn-helix transcriptional regulator [Parazoarcus communis]NMG69742.1 helix-turn-helix domain-containing protein [Parazoarcus communis SWub3 = DSM 12120]PZA18040.1 AraC family transcriptional regulator [Azoarcus communis] [Parazoarcus communis SWub3 = DSM 12120]
MMSRPPEELAGLAALPRAIFGHAESVTNRALGYRHSHPWVQFAYAAAGVLDVRTDNARFIAPPQRAVWIPAGVPHQVWCSANTEIRSLYIEPSALPEAQGGCRVLAVSPLLRELIRSFGTLPVEYDELGPGGRLAAVLLDQVAAAPTLGLMLPLPQDSRLRQVCEALEAEPDSRAGLADWGKRLGCSERTLARLFRTHTGLNFRLWRQRLRLISALPMLEAGERVTDVAIACGYDSVSAFIASFREHFGTTPGEFVGVRGEA